MTPPPLSFGWNTRSNNLYRTPCMQSDCFRDATQNDSVESAAAMGTDHDDVRSPALSFVQDDPKWPVFKAGAVRSHFESSCLKNRISPETAFLASSSEACSRSLTSTKAKYGGFFK